jgi:hypothetical protein
MRSTLFLGGLALLLAAVRPAAAQDPIYTAVVAQDQAEVRSGATLDARLYPTNRLRRGARVEVLEELPGGWLKIRPPQGSYSWINTRFVERVAPDQPNWTVNALPEVGVPVYVGSELQRGRPTVEGCKVTRGHLVRSVGPPWPDEEGSWLPVEPPPGEARYLRAEAVVRDAEAAAPSPSRPPLTAVTVARPGSTPAAVALAVPPATPDALWSRAQQAERSGHEAEAIDLYQRVAQDIASTPELAAQARERALYLRDAQRSPTAARAPSYPTDELPPSDPAASRFYPMPSHSPPGPTVRLAPPCGTSGEACAPGTSPPPATPAGMYSSGPGRLRRAGRQLDGKTAYVLEGGPGRLPLYVTGQTGIDLEPYVNRKVELVGPSIYRGDLRANFMAVSRVQPLPE